MENNVVKEEIVSKETCSMAFAMNKIDGKWIFVLLWYIYEYEVI